MRLTLLSLIENRSASSCAVGPPEPAFVVRRGYVGEQG
jgi:hypothetical protein